MTCYLSRSKYSKVSLYRFTSVQFTRSSIRRRTIFTLSLITAWHVTNLHLYMQYLHVSKPLFVHDPSGWLYKAAQIILEMSSCCLVFIHTDSGLLSRELFFCRLIIRGLIFMFLRYIGTYFSQNQQSMLWPAIIHMQWTCGDLYNWQILTVYYWQHLVSSFKGYFTYNFFVLTILASYEDITTRKVRN